LVFERGLVRPHPDAPPAGQQQPLHGSIVAWAPPVRGTLEVSAPDEQRRKRMGSGTGDKAKGKVDEVKGRAKEAAGRATGDGETAATTGIPATSAFCRISNDARPETSSTRAASGSVPSSAARPTTLSTALCRPTSSRSVTSSPPGSKSPAAWSPPVRSNTR